MTYWQVEYTDTFGGQANYCWVNRRIIEMPDGATDLQIIRKAKAVVGLNGVKGRGDFCGDFYEFRPYKSATVMFAHMVEEDMVIDA